MADIVKINSKKALVTFSKEDLIEHNLIRYIRTSLKGIGKKGLLSDHPFETVAASLYIEKYPSDQVKIAEKCLLKENDEVDVILRVAEDFSYELYSEHPTKRIFKKQEQEKGQ